MSYTFRDPRLSPRFWKFVRPGRTPNDCWVWTGALRKGYGTYWFDGRNIGAHVLAYRELTGPIPAGRELDHVCHDPQVCRLGDGCPHRACVNPDHLQVATRRSNTLRSGNPAAGFARATHCVNGHDFTEENTYWRPGGGRSCRACSYDRGLRYKPLKVWRPDLDTHCIHGHEWNAANTHIKANGEKQCRTCSRIRARKRRARVVN